MYSMKCKENHMSLRLTTIAIASLVTGVIAGLALFPGAGQRLFGGAGESAGGKVMGQALVGGPFSLTDHNGRRVTEKDFLGKPMLVFFGFTFCPDICPSGLQVIAAAIDKLGPKAERIVPLFITIDPERDTPEQLKSYLASFHPRLVGLSGTVAEITDVAKKYRVYFKKVKDEKSSADYTMDHSTIVYLMDAKGKFVAHFSHSTSADKLAEGLGKLL
jgi:cytochrome oxidase Cu insertion factor (SCO1/SenC/PrrC family)